MVGHSGSEYKKNRFEHQDVFNFICGEFKILVGH